MFVCVVLEINDGGGVEYVAGVYRTRAAAEHAISDDLPIGREYEIDECEVQS